MDEGYRKLDRKPLDRRRDDLRRLRPSAAFTAGGGPWGEFEPSVISIAWSTARSWNVWVVRLVGQETVSASTRVASSRPMVSTRLLPPKLELLPIVRWIDRVRPSGLGEVDADAGPERGAVGPGADQLDFQPVTARPRVSEQGVVRLIARRRAAQLHEQVEVAVAIVVGKGDAVPLLEMARPGRAGDVLEPEALDVAEHQLDVQALVRHVAGPQVDVEEPVVVHVAEVRAHRGHGAVEPQLGGDLAKAVGTEVAIQPGMAGALDLHPHGAGQHLGDAGPVVVDVQVRAGRRCRNPRTSRRSSCPRR